MSWKSNTYLNISSQVLLVVSIVLLATIAVGYTYLHLGIYPKAEFRSWIDRGLTGPGDIIDTYSEHPSRAFAFLYMRGIGGTCGTNWACLNFMNGAIPLVGSAIFIVLLIMKFTKNLTIPCLTAAFFLVSYPVLSGWTWQPTALDKFACFFSLTLLYLTYHVFTTKIIELKSLIGYNILFALIITAGMGAKEIFWPVLASLIFIYGAAIIENRGNWKKIKFYILPALLVALIAGRLFYRIIVDSYLMSDHNTGGDYWENVSNIARIFFNHPNHVNVPESLTWFTLIGSVIGGTLIVVFGKISHLQKALIVAVIFSFVVGLGLTSVTSGSGSSPFYFILPIALLFILLGICITQLEFKPVVPQIFAVILLLGIIKSADYSARFVHNDTVLSANFEASLGQILKSECTLDNKLPVLVEPAFYHAGVFVNGTWCSHRRVIEKDTNLDCLGPRQDRIQFSRKATPKYTFPEKYILFDKKFRIEKMQCN